ncbi:MAG: hypothetical protein AAF957_11840 [Planctomycetota bacterium]
MGTAPSFVEDSYKTARAVYRVMLGLCLAVLALLAFERGDLARAREELKALGAVPWGAYGDAYDQGALGGALQDEALNAAIADFVAAADEASRATGVTIRTEDIDPLDLVLYWSWTPTDGSTIEQILYFLETPELTVQVPSRGRLLEDLRANLEFYAQSGVEEAELRADRHVTFYESTGLDPALAGIDDPGRMALVLTPVEDTPGSSGAPPIEMYTPFDEFGPYPMTSIEDWLGSTAKATDDPLRVLRGERGVRLAGTRTILADVRDLDRRGALAYVVERETALARGGATVFGVRLGGPMAIVIGTLLVVGVLFYLLASMRHTVAACEREDVLPAHLPWILLHGGRSGMVALVVTVYALPAMTLGALSLDLSRVSLPLAIIPGLGAVACLAIARFIDRALPRGWGPGARDRVPRRG